jgi:predicted transcriptional regulator of viral defense system
MRKNYTNENIPAGISISNRKKLTVLHRGTKGPFTIKEASDLLNMNHTQTRRFLAYLASRGWLSRIRHGLYITVPLEAINPREWQEDPWVVATKVFTPCYIGGWSACEHWGLTDQIFRTIAVFTAYNARHRNPIIQGTPFRLKILPREKLLFGTRNVWRRESKVQVADPSRTLADILSYPEIGGGIRHVANIFTSYFEGEHRDDEMLLNYALKLGNRTIFKRMGFLLEILNLESPELHDACLKNISSGYTFLDPSVRAKGHLVRRWNLWINVHIAREA